MPLWIRCPSYLVWPNALFPGPSACFASLLHQSCSVLSPKLPTRPASLFFMFGQVSHETEVSVEASKAWELYGSIQLALMVKQEMPDAVDSVDILHGDGGLGTIIQLTFPSGLSYKEKFTKIDDQRRLKETEVIEGGFLDLGFSLYRVRFEIVDKEEESCMIKTTIEYEIEDEASANASMVSIDALAQVAEVAKKRLTQPKQ